MANSKLYNFFFADVFRITIMIFIIIATVLFLAVLAITVSIRKKNKNKFKLVYIIMINVMINAILAPTSYFLNWVVDIDKKELLFGEEDGFFCQSQAFTMFYFQSCREIFVTLISIITFISFKFGDVINIDQSKLSLILILLIGYIIPLIECMTYLLKKGLGQSHLFCFTKINGNDKEKNFSELCGTIHFSFVVSLIIVSIFFISYLIVETSCCKKEEGEELDFWFRSNDRKYCINPNLKKIIFFPIAQIITMSIPVVYRFKNFIVHEKPDAFAGPAAVVNSLSSILYTLVFAISNEIFTAFRKTTKVKNINSIDPLIELEES